MAVQTFHAPRGSTKLSNRPAYGRGLAEDGVIRAGSDADLIGSPGEHRAECPADRLASLCVTYLAALVACLTLCGGAWALGLIAW